MDMLSAWLSMNHMYAWCLLRSDEDTAALALSCHGCWKRNPGPLEVQPTLLTTEVSLKTPQFFLKKKANVKKSLVAFLERRYCFIYVTCLASIQSLAYINKQ